jgi:hypothetical protein
MRMKLVIALCLAAAGTAAAQPTDPPPTGDPTNPNPNPDNPQPPQPPQPPPPQPPPPKPQPPPPPAPVEDTHRPDAFSIAIGLGYVFPTSLETPNITSVRFRLINGLTFEPQIALQGFKDTEDTGEPVDDKITTLAVAALVRKPMVSRGRVDLELLGAFAVSSVNVNPDGEDNEVSTTTTSLTYGFAVTTWLSRHWNFTMSATNPLLSFVKVRTESGPMNVLVQSQTTFGAVFDPTVFAMIHVYH